MLIRNRKVIQKAMRKHAAARRPLAQWVDIAEAGEWHSIIDARAIWPSTDAVKGTSLTCFNIGGNNFRLLAVVSYERQEIVIHQALTHAEYSRIY